MLHHAALAFGLRGDFEDTMPIPGRCEADPQSGDKYDFQPSLADRWIGAGQDYRASLAFFDLGPAGTSGWRPPSIARHHLS